MAWYAEHLGVEFMNQWGMTETSPLGTTARMMSKLKHRAQTLKQQLQNVVPAGLPLPGLEFSIRSQSDLHTRVVHDGKAVGELLVRGPWVTTAYHRNAEASAASDRFHIDNSAEGNAQGKKWLVTGDMASIDAEANVVLRDRNKDMIKSGGEWISSVDLENHIASLPEVALACVVAQPHPQQQERPVAIIVRAASAAGASVADVDEDEVLKHVAAKFAEYQVPDDVLIWTSIPMTSTGKLDKKAVRAKLQAQGYALPGLRH